MKLRLLVVLILTSLALPAAAVPCNPNDPNLRRPNLVGLTPQRVRIVQRSGIRQLQFTALIGNLGTGPFQIASQVSGNVGTTTQSILRADGTTCEVNVGQFPLLEDDDFIRVPNYAEYLLRKDDPVSGPILARSTLRSFCITDVQTVMGTDVPRQIDSSCDGPDSVEGISVGWADVYDNLFPEQTIVLDTATSSLAAGVYFLVVVPDPDNLFWESQENSPSDWGVASVSVPQRVGGGTSLPEPTAFTRATAAPTNGQPTVAPTPTSPPPPTPTNTLRRPSVPTRRPRPTVSRPQPRPRPTRRPGPRDPSPTAAPTETAPQPPPGGATPTATATAGLPPGPQSCPGVPVTCPIPPACKTGNRLGQLYFAYPGAERAINATGYVRLNAKSNGIDPTNEPVSLSLVDKDGVTVVQVSDLHFQESGNGWFAENSAGSLALGPAPRGYGFTLHVNNPAFPPGYFSVVYQMCLSIGDDGVDEQIVCQQKPRGGFLCHSNGPTF